VASPKNSPVPAAKEFLSSGVKSRYSLSSFCLLFLSSSSEDTPVK